MKIATLIITVVVAIAGVVVLASAAFTVQESQQALITQFGRPVSGAIVDAGLHWKVPFVQRVHRFEKRLLEHDGEKTQIPTRDKKFIQLDTFARWRITDPLIFYQSVRDETGANEKLDDIIESETRDAISNHDLIEAVRNTNRTLVQDAEIEEAGGGLDSELEPTDVGVDDGDSPDSSLPSFRGEDLTIEIGREAISREILANAAEKVSDFGIELVDVQIKSINYVPRVQERVFERMISERERIAEKYRAEGSRLFSEFQGRIEKERNRILSEAYELAETLKGEAEAEATRIYAEAYGRDPEFYAFWRTLEIYRQNLGENVSLVISTDSDFFRFLRGAGLTPARAPE